MNEPKTQVKRVSKVVLSIITKISTSSDATLLNHWTRECSHVECQPGGNGDVGYHMRRQQAIKRNGITYLQHLSQKNLSSAFKVSVELKFLRQLVIELFCSISRLKSRNVSSLSVTVSHLRHFV